MNPTPISRRLWWRALMAVSAAAAITVSFTYLRDLALYSGWPATIAWLLPVSCDALAAATLTAYVLTRSWFAAVCSAGLIAATATGNALAHIYDVTNSQPALAVVVAVGITPVLNAFLIGHFVAHETRKAPHDTAGAGDGPLPRRGQTPRPEPVDDDGARRPRTATQDTLRGGDGDRQRDRARTHAATARSHSRRGGGTRAGRGNGPSVEELADIVRRDGLSQRALMAQHGVGWDKAKKATDLVAATNGHPQ